MVARSARNASAPVAVDCMRDTPGVFEKWQETSRQRSHFSCIDETVLNSHHSEGSRDGRSFTPGIRRSRAAASGRGDGPCGLFFAPAISSVDAASFGRDAGHAPMVRLDRAAWLLLTCAPLSMSRWKLDLKITKPLHAPLTRFGVTPSVFRKNREKTLPRSIRVVFAAALHTHHG